MSYRYIDVDVVKDMLGDYLSDRLVEEVLDELDSYVCYSTTIADDEEAREYIERLSKSLAEERERKHRVLQLLMKKRMQPDPALFEAYYGFPMLQEGDFVEVVDKYKDMNSLKGRTHRVAQSGILLSGEPVVWIIGFVGCYAMDGFRLVKQVGGKEPC